MTQLPSFQTVSSILRATHMTHVLTCLGPGTVTDRAISRAPQPAMYTHKTGSINPSAPPSGAAVQRALQPGRVKAQHLSQYNLHRTHVQVRQSEAQPWAGTAIRATKGNKK